MRNDWQDIRHALRMLAKTPALSAVIILTLALGLGATTVPFSIANTLMLRPLPVPSHSQIVAVGFQQKGNPLSLGSVSYAELHESSREGATLSPRCSRTYQGCPASVWKVTRPSKR
jgi:hypothetical protein